MVHFSTALIGRFHHPGGTLLLRRLHDEAEEAIVGRLQYLAEDSELLDRLTAETNRQLQ